MQGAGKSKKARRRANKKKAGGNESKNKDFDGSDEDVLDEKLKSKLPIDSVIRVYGTLQQLACFLVVFFFFWFRVLPSFSRRPSYVEPWVMEAAEDNSGSGFAIEFGGRVLVCCVLWFFTLPCKGKMVVITNAHVVAHVSFLMVRR